MPWPVGLTLTLTSTSYVPGMVSRNSGSGGSGWLVCLLLAAFVIGTDDFVIAGVLPAIAEEQAISEAAAEQLVTVFSITYAAAAPPIAVATARWPRKALVVGGLTVFAALNLLTALAPSYAALMALRVLAALIAASITPAVFATAARLARPDRGPGRGGRGRRRRRLDRLAVRRRPRRFVAGRGVRLALDVRRGSPGHVRGRGRGRPAAAAPARSAGDRGTRTTADPEPPGGADLRTRHRAGCRRRNAHLHLHRPDQP
ncbi:hypothetical protein GCM10023405_00440 [Streptomonospora salina]